MTVGLNLGITASSNFVDDGRDAVAVTLETNATISTDQAKFGSSSLEVTGAQDVYASFDQPDMVTPGAFTIEGWFRPDSVSGIRYILGGWTGSNGTGYIRQNNDNLQITWSTTQYGSNLFNNSLIGTGLSANTWYHVALTWDGSVYRTFLDGTLGATNTSSTAPYDGTGGKFSVGTLPGTTNNFDGYVDEFRMSSIARYTAGFTVPTSAFTNDSDTLILLHFEGSDGDTTTTDDNS